MSKKTSRELASERKRLVFIAFFISFLFCGLILQFYKIQIFEREKWSGMAQAQHEHILIEPFMRGSFYSNTSIKKGHPKDHQLLVFDVPKFHLFIDPDLIPMSCKEKLAEQILSRFALSKEEKEKKRENFYKRSRSRKLIRWLEREERDEIRNWFLEFAKKEKIPRNAIYFVQDYKRSYPFGSLLGQVLHTVQEEKDSSTFQAIPTGGLELSCNEYLKGRQGKRKMIHSPHHPLDTGIVLESPQNGADVYLTINHYLQAIAEEEIEKGVRLANAKSGRAILMDPHSGEILALAEYPPFDPRDYKSYFNNPDLLDRTRVKSISDSYEPASTFKPIAFAICMEANEEVMKRGEPPIFTPEEKIATDKGEFPGLNLKDGRKHRFLNMNLAIQKSSNVYMGKIIQRVIEKMGDQWLRDRLCEWGFGEKTKIEIPGESAGLVPTPGKLHPNGKPEWSAPTPYALSIGHNILVNSIQMVRAFSVIANGGYLIQPTIIQKIIKDGEFVDQKQIRKKKILAETSCRRLIRSMRFVTKRGGTSPKADIIGYTEAGKSGTSEKLEHGRYSEKLFLSSFLGLAPATRPRFVLFVAVDEPEVKFIPGVGKNHHGGTCAAPIFREIAGRTLEYLGVMPDSAGSFVKSDPRYQAHALDESGEIQALINLYKEWNGG